MQLEQTRSLLVGGSSSLQVNACPAKHTLPTPGLRRLHLPPCPQCIYMLLTVVALDYLHDAWFYWTHRMLHWKPLYMAVHLPHHK